MLRSLLSAFSAKALLKINPFRRPDDLSFTDFTHMERYSLLNPKFDFLKVVGKMGLFPHRENQDGTFDSICPKCFKTVASDRNEVKLRSKEKHHICESSDLHKPETKKEYDLSKSLPSRRRA